MENEKMTLEEFCSILKIDRKTYEKYKESRHLEFSFNFMNEGGAVGIEDSNGKICVFRDRKFIERF